MTRGEPDWTQANGVSLRYVLEGAGETALVFLHEMGGTLESWSAVAPCFAASHRVLRYDARGAGLSEKISGSVGVGDFVGDLFGLLAGLEIAGPVVLAGCGVGAAVALAFAGAHPERVRGVLAMAPAVETFAERRAAGQAYVERLERRELRALVEEGLDRTFPIQFRDDDARFRSSLGRLLANDPMSYAATFRMLLELDISGEISAVTCPVLLVAGTLDRTRPPEKVALLLERLRRARLRIVESGHAMPNLTPGLVVEALDDLLAEIGPQSSSRQVRG